MDLGRTAKEMYPSASDAKNKKMYPSVTLPKSFLGNKKINLDDTYNLCFTGKVTSVNSDYDEVRFELTDGEVDSPVENEGETVLGKG